MLLASPGPASARGWARAGRIAAVARDEVPDGPDGGDPTRDTGWWERRGRLGDVLRERGPLAPRTAVQVAARVAEALDDAHRDGYVHGRLGVDDVLLSPPLADTEADLPEATTVRITGLVEADEDASRPSDDVRGAGRLLWVCLTGQEHADDASVPRVEGTDAFTRGLNWVLARSTSPEPAKRHRDAEALRADLLTLVGGRVAPRAPAGVVPAPEALAASTELAPAEETDPAGRPRGSRAAVVVPTVVAVAVVIGVVVLLVGLGRGAADDPGAAETGGATGSGSTDGPGDAGATAGTDGAGGTTGGAVAGDVDGDGRGDVVLVHRVDDEPATLATYAVEGDALVRLDEQEYGDAPAPLVGDLDGDGAEELTTWDEGPGDGDLVLEGPTGTSLLAGAGPTAVPIVGDYDGDGVDDLAFLTTPARADDGTGEVRVAFPGTGDAGAAERWATVPDADPQRDYLVPGDLDGDGDDDLVLVRRDPASGSIRLVPLVAADDAFAAGPASASVPGASEDIFRTADLDGDGVDEVVLVPLVGGADVRSLALADGRLVPADPVGALPGGADDAVQTAGVSDVDGDGRDDLAIVRVLADGLRSRLEVLRSDGDTWTRLTGADLAPATTRTDAKVADGSVHRPLLP